MNGTPARLWEDASARKTEILMITDKRERSATFAAAYADIYMRCPPPVLGRHGGLCGQGYRQ